MYGKWVQKQEVWIFGLEPEGVPVFLAAYGWQVLKHVSYADLAARYVAPTGRALAVPTPVEQMVYAQKA